MKRPQHHLGLQPRPLLAIEGVFEADGTQIAELAPNREHRLEIAPHLIVGVVGVDDIGRQHQAEGEKQGGDDVGAFAKAHDLSE